VGLIPRRLQRKNFFDFEISKLETIHLKNKSQLICNLLYFIDVNSYESGKQAKPYCQINNK
jgi:hypothetical protein